MKLNNAAMNKNTDVIAAYIRPKWHLFSKNRVKGYNNMDMSSAKVSGIKIPEASLRIINTSTRATNVSDNFA
jgi:hypothetical protein